MAWRFHGRAGTSTTNPDSYAICDRCGLQYNHSRLSWQYDWVGERLTNLRILVCDTCYDTPQPQKRPVIVGPDPLPILNPRPEYYAIDEANFLVTDSGGYLVTDAGDNLVTGS